MTFLENTHMLQIPNSHCGEFKSNQKWWSGIAQSYSDYSLDKFVHWLLIYQNQTSWNRELISHLKVDVFAFAVPV